MIQDRFMKRCVLYEILLCGARQLLCHQSSLQDAIAFLLRQNQNALVHKWQ